MGVQNKRYSSMKKARERVRQWCERGEKKAKTSCSYNAHPSSHSAFASVQCGWQDTCCLYSEFLLAECKGLPCIHSVSAMLRLHSR